MSGHLSKKFVSLLLLISCAAATANTTSSPIVKTTKGTTNTFVAPQRIDTKVNINSATPEELAERLNGIGLAKARAIVEYREQHGKFTSPEGLTSVRGIGIKLVERNIDNIAVN